MHSKKRSLLDFFCSAPAGAFPGLRHRQCQIEGGSAYRVGRTTPSGAAPRGAAPPERQVSAGLSLERVVHTHVAAHGGAVSAELEAHIGRARPGAAQGHGDAAAQLTIQGSTLHTLRLPGGRMFPHRCRMRMAMQHQGKGRGYGILPSSPGGQDMASMEPPLMQEYERLPPPTATWRARIAAA